MYVFIYLFICSLSVLSSSDSLILSNAGLKRQAGQEENTALAAPNFSLCFKNIVS